MSFVTDVVLKKMEPMLKKIELWLHRHGAWVGGIFFLFALFFACLWFLQARHMNVVATAVLTHEREPVPQRFPSLESLILSKIDSPEAQQPSPSSEAVTLANQVLRALNSAQPYPPDGKSVISLHTISSDSGDNQPNISKQYLYDDDQDGALFIPAFTLLSSSGRLKGLSPGDIQPTINANPQLLHDIEGSVRVARVLPHFKDKPLFAGSSDLVAQAYFITTTGVTRMWQSNALPSVTRDNFNPHRVFQDRPYFWPSLENPKDDRSTYSYVSKPYFDVAGNGIVRTACWAMRNQSLVSDAVLCVDSLHRIDLKQLLGEYISAQPGTFTCRNKENGIHDCDFTKLDSREVDLINKLKTLRSDLDDKRRFDDLQGGLYVVHRERSPLDAWIHRQSFRGSSILRFFFSSDDESTVYFSVPKPKLDTDKDKSITNFEVYEVSLARPHLWLVGYAFFTFVFGTGAAVCFYVLHRSRVYAVEFMREVETIMTLSPVAFCYLDECDHITSHNQALRDLVGYDAKELSEMTLNGLLDKGDSQTRYDIVSKFREKLLPTPPYEVRLTRKDQTVIPVVISGSPLYIQPHNRHGGKFNQKPHTFGILLRPSEAKTRDFVSINTIDFEGALKAWGVRRAAGAGA
jgi:PAS domain S-box-containing protein